MERRFPYAGATEPKPQSNPSSNVTAMSGICPSLPVPLDDTKATIGPFTTHEFISVIAGVGTLVALALSLALFFQHAFNIRNAHEQIKIMRIISIIPVLATLSWLCINLGQPSIYITMWTQLWEAICLGTFLLLAVAYVVPNPSLSAQTQYFETLPLLDRKKQVVAGKFSSAFYRRARMFVFQSIPLLAAFAVVQCVTQAAGVFCVNSSSPRYAHIWISPLSGFSMGTSLFVLKRLCQRLSVETSRTMMSQLYVLQAVVALNPLQSTAFSIAAGQITPNDSLSYNDLSVGIPNALVIVEMVGFAAAFHKFFSYKSYKADGANALSAQKKMGALLAILQALNPFEVLVAVFVAFVGKSKTAGKEFYEVDETYPIQRSESEEQMIVKPAQAHRVTVEEDSGYHGAVGALEEQGYYAGGGRFSAYSPLHNGHT